jgi:hypothetical protein
MSRKIDQISDLLADEKMRRLKELLPFKKTV